LEKGEAHEPASGVMIKAAPGLNPANEMLHGRLAMLGLVVMLMQATITQTPILDVINTGMGGLLF
jgi:Chlorophyll A-B binding protein